MARSTEGLICRMEPLERRQLLAVTIERTTLNLRFSVDLKPNEAAYGEYQAFKITNTGPTALADVWVQATNFSPTQKVRLGSGEDGLYALGDLGVGAANAETAFIYMVSEQITNPPVLDPQTYTIEVWRGLPAAPGSTLVTTQNDLFQWVGEAVENDSSSRTSTVAVNYSYGGAPTTTPIVGGTMTMRVTGDIKNKPDRILFTPASTLAWPADAFVLEDAVVTYSRNPQLPPDTIFEKPIASAPKDFTVVYTFRIAQPTATATPVTPTQYTAKGVQDLQSRKFEHSQILHSVPDIPPAREATDLVITKTGATTAVAGSGTIYTYAITVTSTGAFAAQGVAVDDAWPPQFNRLPIDPPGSTTVVTTATGFTWNIGPLAAGASTTLTVQFTVPAGTPPGPYVNSATVSSTTPHPSPSTAEITTTVVQAAKTLVTGTDDGCPSAPIVRTLDPDTGDVGTEFMAYESTFRGGVRVATADLDGDGYDEIITAPGRGRVGEIRVWSQAGARITAFTLLPFGPAYVGGVEITTGDFNGDGRSDLVAAMSAGAGVVSVFLVGTQVPPQPAYVLWRSLVPFPGKYTGGVTVAAADFGGFSSGRKTSPTQDGRAELVVGTNAGITATVNVYDLSNVPTVIGGFQPIAPGFTGGVTLSIGRWDADLIPDILVGAGIGGRSVVDVWSGSDFKRISTLSAFSSFAKPNARVFATSLDSDGDGVIDRVFAVQGLQGIAGTRGVTVWNRSTGTTAVLTGSSGLIPPLRITNMTKRPL